MSLVAAERSDNKRPYSKPRLRCFGLVRDLTQAGSGTANESAASQLSCDQLTDRRFNPNCAGP
jgi:hypothetical protein